MIIPLFIDLLGFYPSQVVQDFVHQQYYLKSHQWKQEVFAGCWLVFMAGFRKSSEPGSSPLGEDVHWSNVGDSKKMGEKALGTLMAIHLEMVGYKLDDDSKSLHEKWLEISKQPF